MTYLSDNLISAKFDIFFGIIFQNILHYSNQHVFELGSVDLFCSRTSSFRSQFSSLYFESSVALKVFLMQLNFCSIFNSRRLTLYYFSSVRGNDVFDFCYWKVVFRKVGSQQFGDFD